MYVCFCCNLLNNWRLIFPLHFSIFRMRLLERTRKIWKNDGINSCLYKMLSVERTKAYINVTVDISETQGQNWEECQGMYALHTLCVINDTSVHARCPWQHNGKWDTTECLKSRWKINSYNLNELTFHIYDYYRTSLYAVVSLRLYIVRQMLILYDVTHLGGVTIPFGLSDPLYLFNFCA